MGLFSKKKKSIEKAFNFSDWLDNVGDHTLPSAIISTPTSPAKSGARITYHGGYFTPATGGTTCPPADDAVYDIAIATARLNEIPAGVVAELVRLAVVLGLRDVDQVKKMVNEVQDEV